MGLRSGLNAAQVNALSAEDCTATDLFDDREKLVLHFADVFAAGEEASPELAASIPRYFDDRLVVELALTMAMYLGLAHLTGVIDLPLDER
jgi:hypothetical protein